CSATTPPTCATSSRATCGSPRPSEWRPEMRAPVSWIAEHVALPAELSARALGDALVRVGLEVERVESGADGLSGPIHVGRVLSLEDEPQKNGKTIRWCQVDVGEDEPRGIVCGAHNFAPGNLVVVSLPGAVLPGGFAIS